MKLLALQDRVELFKVAYPKHPASWPWLTFEQGRHVLYAIWVIGADYRNKSRLYGAYPPRFIERVLSMFPDVTDERRILHAFSGSLPMGHYRRCDIQVWPHTSGGPEFQCSIYDLPQQVSGWFQLVLADPPYTAADAERYGTPSVDKRRAIAALAEVTRTGSHLAWLDTCWPMHNKTQWLTVGRIMVQRSTNHRVRTLTLFQRT